MTLELRSPTDGSPLRREHDGYVDSSGEVFPILEGVPRLVTMSRRAHIDSIAAAYDAVRAAEGRTSTGADYYRALPYADLSGRHVEQWSRRAAAFDLAMDHIGDVDGLDVVDVGAGHGWIASALLRRGAQVLAVDINTGVHDGLAAASFHEPMPEVAQAEATRLPLADRACDLIVLAAAAHYVRPTAMTAEAARVLRPGGRLLIFDSPVFDDAVDGEAMVAAQRDELARFGDVPEFDGPGYWLAGDFAGPFRWSRFELPRHRLAPLRDHWTRRRLGRRPARLPVMIGTRQGEEGP